MGHRGSGGAGASQDHQPRFPIPFLSTLGTAQETGRRSRLGLRGLVAQRLAGRGVVEGSVWAFLDELPTPLPDHDLSFEAYWVLYSLLSLAACLDGARPTAPRFAGGSVSWNGGRQPGDGRSSRTGRVHALLLLRAAPQRRALDELRTEKLYRPARTTSSRSLTVRLVTVPTSSSCATT